MRNVEKKTKSRRMIFSINIVLVLTERMRASVFH